ncbi:Nonribosomal peptide synthetase [Tolypocladium paradoxum]|uniref:Nonribosomal peptide synthetase n=1 Tax=Tolypocladium paradoxum TaxID=94208 RepID=A0A2S4KQF5_9HYPO|nr:Nonribosomal peptide synthetase [Tolypocladium paradoxum]
MAHADFPAVDDAVIVCDLPVFPGGRATDIEVGCCDMAAPLPLPAVSVIHAVWSIVLRLYTGLEQICFESVGPEEQCASVVECRIKEDDSCCTVISQLKRNQHEHGSKPNQHRFNTATVFARHSSVDFPRGPSWQAIQAALHVAESGCSLIFRHGLMSDPEARSVAATFDHVLTRLTNPNQPGETIRHITVSQTDLQRVTKWNSIELVSKRELLAHERFSRLAQIQPNSEAIDAWDGKMTYGDLDEASTAVGRRLRRRGIGPGCWVLFCFDKSRWAVISMLAILKAGGACVPLDPRHPEDRVRQIIHTTEAKYAVVGGRDAAALVARSDPGIGIVDATSTDENDTNTDDGDEVCPDLIVDSPAFCLFTSGSTGVPKGIIVPHSHVCSGTWGYATHVGADTRTRILQFSSHTFDICIADVFTALLFGGMLCVPSESARMDGLQEYILQARPNWAALTPTVARMLQPEVVKQSVSKLLLTGESAQDPDIVGWIDAGVEVYNVYGPAENSLITTAARMFKGKPSNIGYGVNTRTWVADVEKGRLVPVGAIGELVIEGPLVAPGYLNDPERTQRSFLSDLDWIPRLHTNDSAAGRFYRTGDLVQYCEDGSLVFVGRADTQVKLGGQRVELTDIESHLHKLPSIRNAAVLVPRSGPLRDRLTALLQVDERQAAGRGSRIAAPFLTSCEPLVASEAAERLRDCVPSYMVPSAWMTIDHLPSSASGKMDRKSLIAQLESLTLQEWADLVSDREDDGYALEAMPGDAMQADLQMLRRVCSQVLNLPIENVLMRKSFVGLGGDSITAMQVFSTLRRVWNKAIRVKDLLSHSSLVEAASRVTALSTSAPLPVVEPLRRYRLTPIQRLFFDTAPTSATWNHYHQSVFMRLGEPREPHHVQQAILGVMARHPMLRARFEECADGEWVQCINPKSEAALNLDFYPAITSSEDREAIMIRARQTLSITEGPLLRAQLFGGGEGDDMLLFIVVHHLVVDLVSWRTILEELEVSLTSALNTKEERKHQLLTPYEESVPFLAWAEVQLQVAQNIKSSHTIPPKPPIPTQNFAYWAINPEHNVYGDVREERTPLGAAITKNVLYDCHRALRTEPVDIFLAGILLSFRRAFPDRQAPPIFNEGHGREPWDESFDVSRTVGWFTTMSPVHVDEINTGDVLDVVRRVKDYRKATQNNGFDYFSSKYLTEPGRTAFEGHIPAEITFNYEGRYQALEVEHSLLKPESWHAGEAPADKDPKLKRFCLFEIAAAILQDGQLHFTSSWNSQSRYQDRISLWLTSLLPAAVGEIVATLMLAAPRFTLADLSQLGLCDYSEAETLTSSVLSIPGVESIEEVEDILPGSPMQDALALSQSRDDTGAYEIEFTWQVSSSGKHGLEDKVDIEHLIVAWNVIVARHAALRTVILEAASPGASLLHQVVLKEYQPVYAVTHAAGVIHGLETLKRYPSYKERGLLLDKKPPHRLLVCTTADGKTLVRLQINHIVFDGLSTMPLLRDFAIAYGARSGIAWPRNASSASFADFIRYIRHQPRHDESIAYWENYLADAEPCLFPSLIDAKITPERAAELKGQRSTVPVSLDVDSTHIDRTLAKLEVTMPAFFQMVWALVLRLYTGSTQSVFGYLASGRDAPVDDIEHAIGPFIAMLVGFVDFTRHQDLSVVEVMKQIQMASAESIHRQASSLAEIQSALNVPGHTRLFNSGVSVMSKLTKSMQITREWALVFDEVSTSDPTEFDLSLIVETGEEESGMSLHLAYRPAAISNEHAANIATTVNHIVSKLIHDPHKTSDEVCGISQLDLDTIWKWNKSLPQSVEECMHDVFYKRVVAHPDREAIYSWDGSLTYKELDGLARRLAKHLVRLGVGPEQRVAVCHEKSLWTVVIILAIIKAGGCFILLDPTQPAPRLWAIVDEADAQLLLCSPFTNETRELKTTAVDKSLELAVLEIDPGFIHTMPLEKGDCPDTPVCAAVGPENAMYIIFTSGTTGKPKGAVAAHRAIATGFHEHAEACGMIELGPKLRSLQFASYSFDASIGDIFATIQAGGCLCIPSEQERNPADLTAFIARSRANWAGLTPSFVALLEPAALPTLAALCVAGEPLSTALVDAWGSRLKLINMYGPSECTVACIANTEVGTETSPSNIGRAFRAATWIVDQDDHNRLRSVGAIGELLIEGPILCRGYLGRQELTGTVFVDSPSWLFNSRPHSRLYKTGDLVRYNADGTICFVGRKDSQIKINGQRVEIGEIEHALSSSLGPSGCPVVVDQLRRGHLNEDDLLAAFVSVGGNETPDQSQGQDRGGNSELISKGDQALAKFQTLVAKILDPRSAASSLPQYMIPQAYIPLERLPLTPAGKVDRGALQSVCAALNRTELLSLGSPRAHTVTAAENNTSINENHETVLVKLWEKVLGVQGVGNHSNFFRLGGNSMAAISLRAEARKSGLTLSVADIFANPTLSEMAKLLSTSPSSSEASSSTRTLSPVASPPSTVAEGDAPVEPFSLLPDKCLPNTGELDEILLRCGIAADEIEDIFPCTPMQEALMVLSSHRDRRGAYALYAPFKLPADLDHRRFQLAWEKTTLAHAILRSRAVMHPRGSLLVVTKSAVPVKQVVAASLSAFLQEQRQDVFQYNSPLLRLAIMLDREDDSHYLVICAHHTIYDGWSMGLIWETALELYHSGTVSRPGPPFQAFVDKLNLAQKLESEQFWREALAQNDQGDFQFPMVPAAHDPIARSSKSFHSSFRPEAAPNTGSTTATLIHAAWSVALSQYSGSQNVSFGVILSGRDFPMDGVERVVGPTIVTIPRNLDVHPSRSVSDFLRHVQDVAVAALPHQHLGLHKIQALGAEAKKSCKFTSILVVNSEPGDEDPIRDAGIVAIPANSPDFHPYPLALEFYPSRRGLDIKVSFDPDCIDELMVGYVMSQFDHILQSICRASSSTSTILGGLMAEMAPTHLDEILTWNSHWRNVPGPAQLRKVHEIVEQTALEQPEDLAIASHDARLTYADLNRCADVLARQICAQGLASPAAPFIGVYFQRSAAAIVSMLAVLKAGFALMPLNPSQPQSRTQGLVGQAGAKLVLTTPDYCGLLSRLLNTECRVLPVAMPNLMHEKHPHVYDSVEASSHAISSDSPAYLLYTSGTTGKPKGVVIQHGAWSSAIRAQSEFFGFGRETRMLQFSSYTWDVSLFEIFLVFAAGGSLSVPTEHDRMNDLETYIRSHGVNSVFLTPTVARLLHPGELTGVNIVIFGGEAVAPSDVDSWARPGRRLINAYGPTEACVVASARQLSPTSWPLKKSSNVGHTLGLASWVVSPTLGTLCPIGAVGELCIAGPALAQGYIADTNKTSVCFPNNLLDGLPGNLQGTRVYRTGDMVRYESDRSLAFLGRQDGQVKLRGQRIEVGEIEHHIYELMSEKAEFRQVTVLLCKPTSGDAANRDRGPFLAALLVMDLPFSENIAGVPCSSMLTDRDENMATTATELKRRLRGVLPDYMVPSMFVALGRLPITPSGKLDSEAIQTRLCTLSNQSGIEEHRPEENLTTAERLLCRWWAELLGVDWRVVRRDADFFALGGNSISAMRLVGLARSARYRLQYEEVFSIPTLSDMAHCLTTAADGRQELETPESAPFDLLQPDDIKHALDNVLPLYGIGREDVADIFPCTPLQEALMAATARHPGAYVLIETMDVPASQLVHLKKAWAAVFRVFDILRTRIVLTNRQAALQVVLKDLPLEWKEVSDVDEFTTLAYDSLGYGNCLVQLAVMTETNALSNGSEEDMVSVAFGAHHAIYDGPSMAMIRQRLYQELSPAKNTEGSNDTTVIPFKAFIKYLVRQDHDEAIGFWREKLSGLSSSAFPPRQQTLASGHPLLSTNKSLKHTVSLPPLQAQRKLGATAATVAHAAWALVISHYTANRDTVFGATFSGRESAATSIDDAESIAGPTIATIPFRVSVDYDCTVSRFLTGLQHDVLQASRFGHIGLERISRINGDCRLACQFDTIFVVQPPPEDDSDKGLPFGIVRRSMDSSCFFPNSLVVDVQPSKDGKEMAITLIYDPTVVQARLPHVILDTFATILHNLLHAAPESPLNQVSAVSADHLSEITNAIPQPRTQNEAAADSSLHTLVRKQVETWPFSPAVEAWDGSMTYAQLDDLSSSLGEQLSRLGIGPDKAVCMLLEKSKWAIVAMLGIAKAGGCFVPLDPSHPPKRLQYVVQTVQAPVVLTSPLHSRLCESLPCKSIVVSEKSLPSTTAAFLKPHPVLPTPVRPHNAAYILFTSGSTGVPKGVVVEHRALCSSLIALGKLMGTGTQSRVLQFNAYWFDVMLLDVFAPLTHGGCVCIPSEEQRINDLAGSINRFQANTITLSTSVSRLIDPASVPSLTTVCLGGEAVLPTDLERWAAGVRLVAGYGPTEACIIAVGGDLALSTPSNSIGKPVECRAWVVNPIKGTELAPFGAVGELYLEGVNLARGYLGDEEKTAKTFITNPPWMASVAKQDTGLASRRTYKTGDLVFFSADGSLNYVGRKDSTQVKIRGQRVELAEIEEAIRRHISAPVAVAVDVFPSEYKDGKQILGAAFGVGNVASRGSDGPEVVKYMQELTHPLLSALRGILPAHMVPEAYIPLANLPVLTTGKLDRKALQQIAAPLAVSLCRGGKADDVKSPRTTTERLMRSLWAKGAIQ